MKKLSVSVLLILFLFVLSISVPAETIRVSLPDLQAQVSKLENEMQELRAKGLEEEAKAKSEEAARLQSQIEALTLAQKEADSAASVSSDNGPYHVTKKKTVRSVTKGDSFQIQVDGRQVRSFKSGNKKVASVSRTGVVKAKNPGTARITITLKNKKKWTVTVKVNPDRDLSKLMGTKFTQALAAVGGKTSQVFKDGKNGDDYSVYKKKGMTLLGLDHKRYRKNKLYKRVWQIELHKKSSFTIFGVRVGDTVKSAMVKLFLAGCTNLDAYGSYLSADGPAGDYFSAGVRNGIITDLKLERRY